MIHLLGGKCAFPIHALSAVSSLRVYKVTRKEPLQLHRLQVRSTACVEEMEILIFYNLRGNHELHIQWDCSLVSYFAVLNALFVNNSEGYLELSEGTM